MGFLFNIYFMRKFSNVVFENYQNLNWTVLDGKLQKNFKFDNFDKAIEFINKVAELSKSENHHPEILNIYNEVTISLFTHDQNKITELDQEMSKKIDDLFNIYKDYKKSFENSSQDESEPVYLYMGKYASHNDPNSGGVEMTDEERITSTWKALFGDSHPTTQQKMEFYHRMREAGIDGMLIFNFLKNPIKKI